MKRSLFAFVSILVLCVAFAGIAQAETYKVHSTANTFSANVTTIHPVTSAPLSRSVYASPMSVSQTGSSETFYTYCLQPWETTNINQSKDYSTVAADQYLSASQYSQISTVFSAAHDVINNAAYQNAVQMIIWEIVMDNTVDFSSGFGNGNFKWNNPNANAAATDVLAKVNEIYSWIDAGSYDASIVYTFSVLANGTTQDLLRFDYTPSAVPVPAAVWLMGTGLAGLVAMRRKKA